VNSRATTTAEVGRIRRDRLATRKEVADYLGVPEATLTAWAHRKIGPPYKIIGRHSRYDWAQVDQWIAQQDSGGAG
jgi:excisionase family DNA binding protein